MENTEGLLQESCVCSSDHSQEIGKLALALAKAQGAMEAAKKDSKNPFFNSKYADLASVWEAIRKPLSDNELAAVQITGKGESYQLMVKEKNGPNREVTGHEIIVTTLLAHSSGEWIRSDLYVKPLNIDPQAIGSALTYGRRYGLAAMVGVAQDDDDGNSGSGRNGNSSVKGKQERKPAGPPPPSKITDVQVRRIGALMKEKEVSRDDMKEHCKKNFKVSSAMDLTEDQAKSLIITLESQPDPVPPDPPPPVDGPPPQEEPLKFECHGCGKGFTKDFVRLLDTGNYVCTGCDPNAHVFEPSKFQCTTCKLTILGDPASTSGRWKYCKKCTDAKMKPDIPMDALEVIGDCVSLGYTEAEVREFAQSWSNKEITELTVEQLQRMYKHMKASKEGGGQ